MSMASSGTALVVFTDDVPEDSSSWMNCVVFRHIPSTKIPLNAAKETEWHSQCLAAVESIT